MKPETMIYLVEVGKTVNWSCVSESDLNQAWNLFYTISLDAESMGLNRIVRNCEVLMINIEQYQVKFIIPCDDPLPKIITYATDTRANVLRWLLDCFSFGKPKKGRF